MSNKTLYVVGELINEKHKSWKMVGVFSKESEAVKACKTENHFVGSLLLNKSYQRNRKWKGAYYPKLQGKPKK
jgi:hypothetical protein